MNASTIGIIVHLLIEVLLIVRVMTRPHRDPASRIAWISVIAALPFLGMLIYLLFGETNIGRRRIQRMKQVIQQMPAVAAVCPEDANNARTEVPERFQHLFRTGQSINGFDVVGGNSASLMADSNATIESMVSDIDIATNHVHLLFYIWLPDHNGLKIVEALKRAAARGVTCRAMADDLGSRTMVHSQHWKDMQNAGVHVARALPIGNPLLRPFHGRIDLRNHRKILVIDGRVTYCGSQNCADPEFLVKAKFAPWVDAVLRFEGPIVRQNQHLFATDWMSYADEDIDDLLRSPIAAPDSGFPAQVIGTGPTVRYSAMPEVFASLFHAARHELTISTPYYVPNETMQNSLCAAARRGVKTTIIFPAKNDSWIVAGASRSYYPELLEAGVEVYEYVGGLLHTKSLTLDGEMTLIGSANMDRRSFDLNYENNILFYDPEMTNKVRARQQEYLSQARPVTRETVESWSLARRLFNNTLATLGPIL
ncbi:cardiolipin synthase [Novipirellula artificiosorum]|uniref:Cardiolipin synthase n=1 Tax=Novipirellula artificiosorum TaxID=2528016 RepID=A0A5C6DEQ5_9BACT|nr:cardiolipin synthase [Novipirellula artificiosorum]TWU34307.1 Cardiolipin synthase [Novipirellula artificiosorum]